MKTALLLSGGGARGALQVAAIEAVADRVHTVCGTSVGAINGAAVAARKPGVLREFWDGIDGVSKFMRVEPDLWNGIYGLGPLHRLLEDAGVLRPVLPFFVGCFDFATARHRLVEVEGDPDQVWACIQASASIPLQHEAVKLGGRWTGDGGVASPLPPLRDWETFDEVHAVFCTPTSPGLPEVSQDVCNRGLEQAERALDFLIHRSVIRCAARLLEWKRRRPSMRIVVYEPTSWEHVGKSFDAHEQTIRRRLAHGAEMVRTAREL